jgi:4-amino-4-deoxy-L-arabinose transferase-like glycosyltransferase
MRAIWGSSERPGERADEPSLSWADTVWISAIVVLAFILRLVWVLYAEADPLDGRLDDSVFYHLLASSLADGGPFSSPYTFLPTAQWRPGYVFFLTPLYWLFGNHYEVAEVANAVLGAATAGLTYILTLRLFDRPSARIAALLLAVFPGQVLYASLVYSEPLFTFLLVLGLVLLAISLERGSDLRPILGFAIVAGVATLVRENGLALIIIAAIAWLARDGWRVAVQRTAVVAAAAALVVLPWTVRNATTMDAPLPVSSSSGLNFWLGHNENAGAAYVDPGPFLFEHGPIGRPGGEVDVNNAGWREGMAFALTHPVDELILPAKKVRLLYQDDLSAFEINEHLGLKPFMSPAVRGILRPITNYYYFAVLAASVLALVRSWRTRPAGLLLPLLTIAVLTAGNVAFFSITRFHVPIMPMFCVLAGYGLAGVPAMLADLRGRPR